MSAFAVAAVVLAGCSSHGDAELTAYRERPACLEYFATAPGFDRHPGVDEFLRETLAAPLSALGEPCLHDVEPGRVRIFRFLWVGSFDPAAVVTVYDGPQGCRAWGGRVRWDLESTGEGVFGLGVADVEVVQRVDVSLDRATCEALAKRVDAAGFWSLPATVEDPGILDGADWILEASRPGAHHLIRRRLPTESEREPFRSAFRAAGLEAPVYGSY